VVQHKENPKNLIGGIAEFRIEDQLKSHICPVCRAMDTRKVL
jgi:hypothetical protein